MGKEVSSSFLSIPSDLWLIYLNLTFYALCFQSQAPLIPYLVKSFSNSSSGSSAIIEYGTFSSFFSFIQLFGGLFSGPLIDKYGCKNALMVSYFSSFLCYVLTGTSNSLVWLYFSRVPTIVQHAMMASRVYVTLRTDESSRARLLAYIGVSYGIGMAIGPAIGGLIGIYSFIFSALGSLASVFIIHRYLENVPPSPISDLPKVETPPSKQEEDENVVEENVISTTINTPNPPSPTLSRTKGNSICDLEPFRRVLKRKGVLSLLFVKVLLGMAAAMIYSILPIVAVEKFQLQQHEVGFLMSYFGVLTVIVQGWLVGWATRHYSDSVITRICMIGMTLSLLALSLVSNMIQMCIIFVPCLVFGTLFSNVNTAQLTKVVPREDAGTIISLDMGIASGVRVFSPSIGSNLIEKFGFPAIGGSSFFLALIGVILLEAGFITAKKHE